MIRCYITGTSRGIGKALALSLLEDEQFMVTGISRHCSIHHPRYMHVYADLSSEKGLEDVQFDVSEDLDQVILVNNSGELGEMKHVGDFSEELFVRTIFLNLTAPCLLINRFVQSFKTLSVKKSIINISSGAGKNPVDGWSSYCASKAGIDMFSRVADVEFGLKKSDIKIYSIAPGMVDTEMQERIRKTDEQHFSRKEEFINYHENNALADPHLVAKKFFAILAGLFVPEKVVFSLSEFK